MNIYHLYILIFTTTLLVYSIMSLLSPCGVGLSMLLSASYYCN